MAKDIVEDTVDKLRLDSERLSRQLEFIIEIDKLKQILRQTVLIDKSRQENDAEHSWHLAMMVMILKEYAPEGVRIDRAMKMVLVHDLVEIDAGDTFCYDEKANLDKRDRELKAADRIFNILPQDQAKELRDLWDEFEEGKTVDALFAIAMDRLQPLLHNHYTSGHTWAGKIRKDQVISRMSKVKEGAADLWLVVEEVVKEGLKRGYLKA